jgi:hypothetical protein
MTAMEVFVYLLLGFVGLSVAACVISIFVFYIQVNSGKINTMKSTKEESEFQARRASNLKSKNDRIASQAAKELDIKKEEECRDLWRGVYISRTRAGECWEYAENAADKALQIYKKRFNMS